MLKLLKCDSPNEWVRQFVGIPVVQGVVETALTLQHGRLVSPFTPTHTSDQAHEAHTVIYITISLVGF